MSGNNRYNQSHNSALTDAERAERVRRLNELYQQQQYQQPHYNSNYMYTNNNNINNNNYNGNTYNTNRSACYVEENTEEDDDDDNHNDNNAEDKVDDGEEAFLEHIEQHMNTSSAAAPAPSGAATTTTRSGTNANQTTFYRIDDTEMNSGTVVATEANVHRRTIGDFELLRLAKVGDKQSFFDFANMTHANIATFEDNQKRNALHYAADSGNVQLLRALREDEGLFNALNVKDVKGMLPIDFAVLNHYSKTAVLDLLQPHPSAETATQEDKVSQLLPHDYEAILTKFAPTPPRFVLSKPIPPPPTMTNHSTLFMRSF